MHFPVFVSQSEHEDIVVQALHPVVPGSGKLPASQVVQSPVVVSQSAQSAIEVHNVQTPPLG